MEGHNYPFQLVSMTPEEEEMRKKLFPSDFSIMKDSVITKPGNVWMPKKFTPEIAKKIYNLPLRNDDIWIITYPKCGTTWSQEMVWQIVNGCQFEMAKIPLFVRSPYLEFEVLEVDKPETNAEIPKLETINAVQELPSPRIVKSHLPLDMMPPNILDTCKVVYVARNPKDCCVSYFHHYNLLPIYQFEGTFDDFADIFKKGKIGYGDYWYHLNSAWKHNGHPNLKMIWFEDMKKDLGKVIREVSDFLGKPLTPENVDALKEHLKIDNFRKLVTEHFEDEAFKAQMVKFFRKGEVGDWKNHFAENNSEWDKWIREHEDKMNIKIKYE